MIRYIDLVNSYKNNPHDVITKLLTKKEGKWFYVYVDSVKAYKIISKLCARFRSDNFDSPVGQFSIYI